MLQFIKIIEKISSTFIYDVPFQGNSRHEKYWRVSKKDCVWIWLFRRFSVCTFSHRIFKVRLNMYRKHPNYKWSKKRDIDFKNRCKNSIQRRLPFNNLNVILGNRTPHTSCSNKSTKSDLDVLKQEKKVIHIFDF